MPRRYWLLKTEPHLFSVDDLERAPEQTTIWDGVRNYQARNLLRDEVSVGDHALLYHSQVDPPAVVGVVAVVRAGFPDPSQFDPRSPDHDPASSVARPRWFAIEVRLQRRFTRPLLLPELRTISALAGMELLRRGSRLSVQPVTAAEWRLILRAASK